MRILLVSNLYPPYWIGGYERLAAWVAEGLEARGHIVHVLTGRGPLFAGIRNLHAELDLDLPRLCEDHFGRGISFPSGLVSSVSRHVFSWANFRTCRRTIEETQPDLVSFWNPAFITFSPLLAAQELGVPKVVHLSDTVVNPFRNPHAPRVPPGLRGAARLAVDTILRRSDAQLFIVPSSFSSEKFVRSEHLPPSRVSVLPWFVPPPLERALVADRALSVSRLLFVGSLAPEKGALVLIEAFRRAVARQNLSLTIVGDGSQADGQRLREAASGLPVRFLGRLDHEAVIREYSSHDALVFPSVWDEPFAIVPLEAMASGLPVIASTTGGTPEAILHGTTGLLVPPGDVEALCEGILRLAQDPKLAQTFGRTARAYVCETWGFTGFLKRLEALYATAAAVVTRKKAS